MYIAPKHVLPCIVVCVIVCVVAPSFADIAIALVVELQDSLYQE